MGIEHIQKEVLLRHAEAFDKVNGKKGTKTSGDYKWRAKGEYHMFNPESIYKLQMLVVQVTTSFIKEYAKGNGRNISNINAQFAVCLILRRLISQSQ